MIVGTSIVTILIDYDWVERDTFIWFQFVRENNMYATEIAVRFYIRCVCHLTSTRFCFDDILFRVSKIQKVMEFHCCIIDHQLLHFLRLVSSASFLWWNQNIPSSPTINYRINLTHSWIYIYIFLLIFGEDKRKKNDNLDRSLSSVEFRISYMVFCIKNRICEFHKKFFCGSSLCERLIRLVCSFWMHLVRFSSSFFLFPKRKRIVASF